MAFTWNTIDEKIILDDYTEIKNNIDTVATNLPGSPGTYSWIYDPTVGDIIDATHIQELRDATDWLDDNNVCNTDNSSYDSGVDGDQDTGINSGYDYSEDGSYDYGVDGSYNYSADGTYDSLVQTGENGTYFSTYYTVEK